MTQPLPTRADEDWRYADLAALAPVWPPVEAAIVCAEAETRAEALVIEGAAPQPRALMITLAAGAALDLHVLNIATGYGRIAIDVTLGEGARFALGAVQIAGGAQTLELVTRVHHTSPDAVSRQVVRQVAGGKAVTNYLGRVMVARGANGTDGEQQVRAMLLNRGAAANARPELEIYADDVKCAHGCAIGELDRQALFYCASRGLPPATAKALLLRAFVAEALDGAPDLAERAAHALEAVL